MKRHLEAHAEPVAILAVTLGALTVWVAGLFADLGTLVGGEAILAANEAYLDEARRAALQDSLLLGEVLALLEVLRSTDLGLELIVSVDVQAGQALSALTAAVERAMGAALAATVLTEALIWLNRIGDLVALWALRSGAMALAVWMLLRILGAGALLRSLFRRLSEVLVLVFLLGYLVLPYSISLGGALSESAAGALASDTATTPDRLHTDILGGHGLSTDLSFWSKSGNVRASYETLTSDLADKVSAMSLYGVERLAHLLIVGVLFPAAVALVLLVVAWRILGPVMSAIDRVLAPRTDAQKS